MIRCNMFKYLFYSMAIKVNKKKRFLKIQNKARGGERDENMNRASIQQISVAISKLSIVFKVVIIALFEFSFPPVYVRINRVLDELYHFMYSDLIRHEFH